MATFQGMFPWSWTGIGDTHGKRGFLSKKATALDSKMWPKQVNIRFSGHVYFKANRCQIVGVLQRLGVHTMSFFMFGVDNFKRSSEEVANLMDIIKDDLRHWTAPGGIAHQLEVQINHCGERDLLESEVIDVLDHAMDVTRCYKKWVFPKLL